MQASSEMFPYIWLCIRDQNRSDRVVVHRCVVLCGLMDGVRDLTDVSSHHFPLQGQTHTHRHASEAAQITLNQLCMQSQPLTFQHREHISGGEFEETWKISPLAASFDRFITKTYEVIKTSSRAPYFTRNILSGPSARTEFFQNLRVS